MSDDCMVVGQWEEYTQWARGVVSGVEPPTIDVRILQKGAIKAANIIKV